MIRIFALLGLSAAILAGGCAETRPTFGVVSGDVTYEQRAALPPDAELEVRLYDLSRLAADVWRGDVGIEGQVADLQLLDTRAGALGTVTVRVGERCAEAFLARMTEDDQHFERARGAHFRRSGSVLLDPFDEGRAHGLDGGVLPPAILPRRPKTALTASAFRLPDTMTEEQNGGHRAARNRRRTKPYLDMTLGRTMAL
jgi:hypothetical protein